MGVMRDGSGRFGAARGFVYQGWIMLRAVRRDDQIQSLRYTRLVQARERSDGRGEMKWDEKAMSGATCRPSRRKDRVNDGMNEATGERILVMCCSRRELAGAAAAAIHRELCPALTCPVCWSRQFFSLLDRARCRTKPPIADGRVCNVNGLHRFDLQSRSESKKVARLTERS